MRLHIVAIGVVTFAVLVSGCGATTTGLGASTSPAHTTPVSSTVPSTTASLYAVGCKVNQLKLDLGQRVSEPTGQHTLALELTNVSASGCHLSGYPGVALLDSTARNIPFDYAESGDQVVTAKPPGNVDLAPRGIAYVTINKYRCDVGDITRSAGLRLTPPGSSSFVEVVIPSDLDFAYCGPGDPGSTVHISPVEPSFTATIQG